MLLAEHMGDEAFRDRVKLYATDADGEAIAAARQGHYPAKALSDVDPGRVERFFERSGDAYVFRRDLRRSLIFGRHDLVQDAPISRTDLISCRNTLMYLNSETQARVLDHFRFSLRERGFLVLGKSEMLFTRIRAFVPVDLKRRVFAKQLVEEDGERMTRWDPAGGGDAGGRSSPEMATVAFDEAPVPQILVRADGIVLRANRRARELFALSEAVVGRRLQDMEVSFRPVELRGPIEEAMQEGQPVRVLGVQHRAGPATLVLDVEITPLGRGEAHDGVVIAFVDVSEAQRLQADLESSNQELETAMEELQSTNEELETTNEELQSTNEELETTNEELQSTNEELETMNEELQSTNEELQAVNVELQQRSAELTGVNAFMSSILAGVRAGVVVVDRNLRIEVWNRMSEDLWGLRADEVRGQSLVALDIGLPLDPVRQQIVRTLGGDADGDVIEVDATNRRGRPVRCRITCSRFEHGGDHPGVILLVEPIDPGARS
jgi:two-component system CheB/CheR fusion protein